MALSSTLNSVTYRCDGESVAFETGFEVLDEEDLVVVYTGAGGDEDTLALTTDYTVALDPENKSAVVACLEAPAVDGTLFIRRRTALTQPLNLLPQGPLPAEALKAALKRIVMATQDIERRLSLGYVADIVAAAKETHGITVMAGATLPTTPPDGQFFYNTQNQTYYVYSVLGGRGTWNPMFSLRSYETGVYGVNVLATTDTVVPSQINMGGKKIVNVNVTTSEAADVATKKYVDDGCVFVDGSQMSGDIDCDNTARVVNVPAPTAVKDASNAIYFGNLLGRHKHNGTDSPRVGAKEVDGVSPVGGGAWLASNGVTFDLRPGIRSDFAASVAVARLVWRRICTATIVQSQAGHWINVFFCARGDGVGVFNHGASLRLVDDNTRTKLTPNMRWRANDARPMHRPFSYRYRIPQGAAGVPLAMGIDVLVDSSEVVVGILDATFVLWETAE